MSKAGKIILLIAVIIYVLSPVDALPGPIDDIIITILSIVLNNAIAIKEEKKDKEDIIDTK